MVSVGALEVEGMLFQAMWTQRDCRNMLQLNREQNWLWVKGSEAGIWQKMEWGEQEVYILG